jgi:hypothetical protein
MENNIIDELLNKIKSLESTNSNLKNKIKQITLKLESGIVLNKNSGSVNFEDGI